MAADFLSVPVEGIGSSHSAVELPQFRRVGSDESRNSNSSSSPIPADREWRSFLAPSPGPTHRESFWDTEGEKSTINLLSADEEKIEKWMISQVSNSND